ncbi:MAG: hypothetical protein HeimC2_32910 [Candidatus Heimdallarchaeota archaeon LC_2]|nr:MAG: hypothetical protein HeimC2_32910 [Candidatus Heimdallarchaeota archaeon LC_2]
MSMATDLNTYIMENIYIIGLAFFITIIAAVLMYNNNPRAKTVGKVSLGVGAFSIVYLLLGVILVVGAGSTIVIGNWLVYGETPNGNLQWGLVFYALFLLLAYATGFFAAGTQSRKRSKKK